VGACIIEPRTLPTLPPLREVSLLPYGIRFGQPRAEFGVDVLQGRNAKNVEVIAWRECLDAPKARTFEAHGEYHVSIEPCSTRRHLGK
jgi:hypothetical protein